MTPNSGNYRLLIVDDEPDVREFMSYNLIREGYTVFTASNGKEAVEIATREMPHLILMDVMMPGMDGIEACSEIRTLPDLRNSLICFLTARGEDYSQIAGFEAGGDDYIIKPVRPKVLAHRIKALLKRYRQLTDSTREVRKSPGGSVLLDREKYLVTCEGKELTIPKKEFELLSLLISKPGRVFTRDEIYSEIWGDSVIVGERTIDVHIRKLRERLGEKYIHTLKGVGYKFQEKD
jgi:two-component system alkaline phosphatase synthesis response regulator PhoP